MKNVKGLFVFAILLALLMFTSCGTPAKRASESDLTYMRILYQVELDLNADAPRFVSEVTTVPDEEVVGYDHLGAYYMGIEKFMEGTYEEYVTAEQAHNIMRGIVLPLKESDGTVNNYICYEIYDNSMISYFTEQCDNLLFDTEIKWHFDTRGNRIIDEFDKSVCVDAYSEFWRDQNEKLGVVPPVLEMDLNLSGEVAQYVKDDICAEYCKDISLIYPNVKPYGVDYPVSE